MRCGRRFPLGPTRWAASPPVARLLHFRFGPADATRRLSGPAGALLPPTPLSRAGVCQRSKEDGTQTYRHCLPLDLACEHAGREEGTGLDQYTTVRSGAGRAGAVDRASKILT